MAILILGLHAQRAGLPGAPGVEGPLAALGLAALIYGLHPRLTCGDPVHGLIGVAACCASPGLLSPAFAGDWGGVPSAVALLLATLAAGRRRWFLAGAASAVASLEASPGLLLLPVVLAAAALHGAPGRRSMAIAGGGILTTCLAWLLGLALRGEVGAFLEPALQEASALATSIADVVASPGIADLLARRPAPTSLSGGLAIGGGTGFALLAIGVFTQRRKALGAQLLVLVAGLVALALPTILPHPAGAAPGLALAQAIGLGHLASRLHESQLRWRPRGTTVARLGDLAAVGAAFACLLVPVTEHQDSPPGKIPASASPKLERGE